MGNSTKENDRRQFLGGALGFVSGLVMLSTASAVTIFRFIFGERLSKDQQLSLQSERLKLQGQETELGKLELERQGQDQIFVSKLSDLEAAKGKYFTDYQMQQALAFLDKDNLPILLSAKCTHLGCTVGAQVDDQGRVLCPCHISYFNIETGQPSEGSPAKKPLPHLSWALKNDRGEVVAKKVNGELKGNTKNLDGLSVYLLKEDRQGV